MKSNIKMNKQVQDTLDSATSINQVKVSPFFKEKLMQQIRNVSEDINDTTWSWFTPKLQLATLVCIVTLNIIVFKKAKETTYNENVSSFATSYGLSISNESSLLN